MRYLYTTIIVLGLLLAGCGGDDGGPSGPDPADPTPSVDFTYSPESPEIGEEVTFNGEVNEGSSEITSWEWNFGDDAGTTENGQSVSFTYESAGSYDVVLTASDDNDQSVDVEKTVTVEDPAAGEPATLVWSFDTGNTVPNPNEVSSPAIADDGTIYYTENNAGADSRVISITDNGDDASMNWDVSTNAAMRQAPAIGPDGGIYIGDMNAELHKIGNGDILWSANTDGAIWNSTATFDGDGNVYINTEGAGSDGGVLSFASDGTELWERSSIAWLNASPAFSNDGSVMYALVSNKGFAHAINPADGSSLWSTGVPEGPGTSISVDSDGTVYFTTSTEIVALTDNGEEAATKWSQGGTNPNRSGVVVGPDGNLYVGAEEGLLSLNPVDGSVNWIYDEITVAESVPAVDSNGNIYVGSTDGRLSILNSSGELVKEFELGTNVVNSPVIADDGTVYVEAATEDNGSYTITLNKIEVEESSGPADSNWPMKGKNRKNTSN